jgi:preprotein translocase subunit SecG
MNPISLLAVGFIMKIVAFLFGFCSLALILIILIQKGRGGGLSGAFGGAMASGILGSKTGDFLTWVTIVLVSIFLTLAIVMAKFYKPAISDFGEAVPQRTALPTDQPTSPEPSPPVEDLGILTGDANEPGDTNLPGG